MSQALDPAARLLAPLTPPTPGQIPSGPARARRPARSEPRPRLSVLTGFVFRIAHSQPHADDRNRDNSEWTMHAVSLIWLYAVAACGGLGAIGRLLTLYLRGIKAFTATLDAIDRWDDFKARRGGS